MSILGGIKFVRIMTKGHPRLLGWTLKLLCALDLFLPPIGTSFEASKASPRSYECEWFKELESQMRRVEIKETNKEKIKRFVSGLKRDIQDEVELCEYSTLENVFTLALGLKFNWKEKEGQRRVTHPTTTLVTHGRERIKRNMISSLLTLIKNH